MPSLYISVNASGNRHQGAISGKVRQHPAHRQPFNSKHSVRFQGANDSGKSRLQTLRRFAEDCEDCFEEVRYIFTELRDILTDMKAEFLSKNARNALEQGDLKTFAQCRDQTLNHRIPIFRLETLHLKNIDLSDRDLSNIDLSGVHFDGAKLLNANLTNAKLVKTSFSWANLSGANLSNTDLTSAVFNGTSLSEANLSRANLTSTSFLGADLRRANLFKTLLKYTNFRQAKLHCADFSKARFINVDHDFPKCVWEYERYYSAFQNSRDWSNWSEAPDCPPYNPYHHDFKGVYLHDDSGWKSAWASQNEVLPDEDEFSEEDEGCAEYRFSRNENGTFTCEQVNPRFKKSEKALLKELNIQLPSGGPLTVQQFQTFDQAFKKWALKHHPDKVPDDQKTTTAHKFKAMSTFRDALKSRVSE